MERAPPVADPHSAPSDDPLGDAFVSRLHHDLVAIAPTNLEDVVHSRYEKPRYPQAAQRIARAAAESGLVGRVVEASDLGVPESELHGVPRPNVVIDLDVGATSRVLLLAHYDVVPVPEEQLARWKSPPHELTAREDGRLYGRGANDDLGSGVVGCLLALRRLRSEGGARHNVRLLVCCDEETGGEGGVEALKHADERAKPTGDRYLVGDVALIPDGSPHTTVGSSGLLFLDAVFGHASLTEALEFGASLVRLHETASKWISEFPSEDWPDHGAPDPHITGRATVTQLDWRSSAPLGPLPALRAARAETDAANQVAEAVTLVFRAEPAAAATLEESLTSSLPAPFHLSREVHTSLPLGEEDFPLQVVGQSTHGGYPHRGHNPVPAAMVALRSLVERGALDGRGEFEGSFAVDLRLPPEMPLELGRDPILAAVRRWIEDHRLRATIEAPPARARAGYALTMSHPQAAKLQRILQETMGSPGLFGEYGGTDASSLSGILTPGGEPLPALVFGSMDRQAHIHEAEESVDPRLIRAVAETIVRFVREP